MTGSPKVSSIVLLVMLAETSSQYSVKERSAGNMKHDRIMPQDRQGKERWADSGRPYTDNI